MLLFGDGVVVAETCVVIVFLISELANFGKGSLARLGVNCCVGQLSRFTP